MIHIPEMMRVITRSVLLLSVILSVGCQRNPKEVKQMVKPKYTLDSAMLTVQYVTGQFDPKLKSNFTEIDTTHADRPGLYLLSETYEAFKKMWSAAKSENVDLVIRSATRNFIAQKNIWERKWQGSTRLSDGTYASDIESLDERSLKILLYSSMPGTSRHHWGTDIDMNSFNNAYFESGSGLKVYEWLTTHAKDYGFFQPYTSKESGRTGYEEEKWHWSYSPISDELTEYCKENLSNKMIEGFEGSETAEEIDVLSNYVLGIDSLK